MIDKDAQKRIEEYCEAKLNEFRGRLTPDTPQQELFAFIEEIERRQRQARILFGRENISWILDLDNYCEQATQSYFQTRRRLTA